MTENKSKLQECEVCEKGGEWQCCGKCKGVFYCSKECQTSDWSYHKRECKAIKAKKRIIETVEHIGKNLFKGEDFKKIMAAIERRKDGVKYIDVDVSLLDPECSHDEMIKFMEIKETNPKFNEFNEDYEPIYEILKGYHHKIPKNSFILRGYCLHMEHWILCMGV
jgi:hypothetical protein